VTHGRRGFTVRGRASLPPATHGTDLPSVAHSTRHQTRGSGIPSPFPLALYASMTYSLEVDRGWNVVHETAAYLAHAEKLMTSEERDAVVEMLARNPECGVLIEGTGGVRKVRFAIGNRGKSGGVRVLYYFHSEVAPVYLLLVFAKKDQANLSAAQANTLAGLVRMLKAKIERKR